MTRSGATLIRVRYSETDQMRVAHHANHLIWFEIGRTDLLRDLGWSYREMEATGFGLPVIEVRCAYHRPARYDDEIEVRTTGRLESPVRISFDYEAVRRSDGAVMATGQSVHAAINLEGRPCRLPERVKDLFR